MVIAVPFVDNLPREQLIQHSVVSSCMFYLVTMLLLHLQVPVVPNFTNLWSIAMQVEINLYGLNTALQYKPYDYD